MRKDARGVTHLIARGMIIDAVASITYAERRVTPSPRFSLFVFSDEIFTTGRNLMSLGDFEDDFSLIQFQL